MRRFTTLFAVATAISMLSACGGGGGGAATGYGNLNRFESRLAGVYELADFEMFDAGVGPVSAHDAASWSGTLVLDPDRRARIRIDVVGPNAGGAYSCDREFLWRADAGWLLLDCAVPGELNAMAEWDRVGIGGLLTNFQVPTGRTDCWHLLVSSGYERFEWAAVE